MSRARYVASFAAGLLFALGLGLSGMTQPARVLGFLDFAGAWDPSLACVMAGAVGVGLVLFRLVLARPRPLYDAVFHLPTQTTVDARLLGGAALFGVGWGLSGYCPGPALVNLATGARGTVVFVLAMVLGSLGAWWAESLALSGSPRARASAPA